MSKPAPTLIDEIYRASFAPRLISGWKSNEAMRKALLSARRFTINETTSAFMAELANEAFLKTRKQPVLANKLADSLRIQSRLPHENIWIEYFMRPYQHRAHEMLGTTPPVDEEIGYKEGWLIQQHPQIETACMMHVFTQGDEIIKDKDGYKAWTFPFAFGWCCDDTPLPWRRSLANRVRMISRGHETRYAMSSAFLVGLYSYDRDNVSCVHSPLIEGPRHGLEEAYTELLQEWTGVIRRVWALLATIDSLPITRGNVRQSRGFLARGRIRPFLDHQTITLNIPHRTDTRKLARKVIAIAHRKRHEVRGHWRDDHNHLPVKGCPHIWEIFNGDADTIACKFCAGRQFYIKKHERGDAALGYVLHDYRVVHEENRGEKRP